MSDRFHSTGRPHLPSTVHQWLGDSRGHWEGDTLVVDTTNYKPRSFMTVSSEKLHVIERFTRTGPESLKYEITIDDPGTWTKPWSLMIPLQAFSGSHLRVRLPGRQYRPGRVSWPEPVPRSRPPAGLKAEKGRSKFNSYKVLFRGLIPAVAMATDADNISGFRLAFAIGAAIFAAFLALHKQLGWALLLGFHRLRTAFRVPKLVGRRT